MKYNKKIIIGISIILLVAILLFPFIFKDRTKISPSPAGPYLSEIDYTEIFFNNNDLRLSGMLLLPDGEEDFPVAVIIHGSGTSKRDNRWYLAIAKHLQENGIAVLLPDKRGSEKSEGNWRNSTFMDLAGDTISAIEFVRNQKQFDYSYIGVIGISQGGWIAPLVANRSEDVSFVVSLSGAAVTIEEQVLHESVNYIIDSGTYRFLAKLIAPIFVNIWKKGEFGSKIAGFDPIPFWKNVNVPVFAALGENDKNVPVEESVKRLRELNKDITIKVYPEGGHGILDSDTHKVRDDFLSDLTEFIENAGKINIEKKGFKNCPRLFVLMYRICSM